MRAVRCTRFLLLAVVAAGLRAEPPAASATPPPEDAINAAKRDYDLIKGAKSSSLDPQRMDLPRMEAPAMHLSSDEILNVAANPTAHLVATKFVFNGDKVSEIDGNLTLNGKTNPVVLKAQNYNCYNSPMIKREVCGGDFDTTIVRSQYGVTYGLNYGFPDNVHLVIQVEAVKQ